MNRLLLTAIASIAIALPLAAIDDPVHTSGGLVAGAAGNNAEVRVYKGIPYAAPPLGQLRWAPPEAAASWKGVKQATEFSSGCMQEPYPETSIYYQPPRPTSEDCLYLNI